MANAEPSEVIFAVEPLANCRNGLAGLAEEHGTAFTFYKDRKGPADPDWNFYEGFEGQGRLKICTARHDGELVGYFLIVTGNSAHYRNLKLCLDDTFYLKPEYRRGFGLYSFVKFCTEQMRDFGGPGSCLVVADKTNQDMKPILKRLGFIPEEIRWTKMVEA